MWFGEFALAHIHRNKLPYQLRICLFTMKNSFPKAAIFLRNMKIKVEFFFEFLIIYFFCSTVDADQIFKDAEELNMTGSGYVWIVTEQALSSQNVPSGTLGLELVGAANEEDHINDSL